jgi:polysaccharide export outer membrane protein
MQPARLGAVILCLSTPALFCSLVLAPSSNAQTVETSQQVNERIRALAAASHAPAATEYVIGSGDLVSVQVFDVPELSRDLRVSQTGTIGVPLIPVRLHVAGLTEVQAERKIVEVLEANGLVSHAEVSVAVREKKSKPITIVGAVAHPMVYSADRQITLVEVLAEAGGILSDAGDSVIITRPDRGSLVGDSSEPPAITQQDSAPVPAQPVSPSANSGAASKPTAVDPVASQSPVFPSATAPPASEPAQIAPPPLSNTITVNLNQILEAGNMQNNIVLEPGDVVTVPHAGIVYALGAVAKPGGFTVSNDRGQLTTLKLLSLAGGLNRSAKSDHAVIVRKDSSGKQREVEVDLRKVMHFQAEDVQLRPSDILYVPNNAGKQAMIRAGELALGVGTGVVIYRLIP